MYDLPIFLRPYLTIHPSYTSLEFDIPLNLYYSTSEFNPPPVYILIFRTSKNSPVPEARNNLYNSSLPRNQHKLCDTDSINHHKKFTAEIQTLETEKINSSLYDRKSSQTPTIC